MKNYNTLSQEINKLKEQGHTEDFTPQQNCLECRNGEYKIFQDEFRVDKYFRLEDNTDPSDQSIPYAISSDKYKLKGVLLNGYGIFPDIMANEMLDKLTIH